MWSTFAHYCAILIALGSSVLAATNDTTETDPSPETLLADFAVKLPEPVVVGNPTFTCKVFQTLFPKNETFSSQSAFYTPLYEVPWSQTCWLEPACVVTPNTAGDLSKILRVLRVFKTPFAIRSGGHSISPGFSGIGSNGILLALQNLNTLAISPDKKTVTVGTGNRWGAVYKFAAQNGVNIVGGREPMVGVGGLLLGGGLSIFYNSYGLGIDQVVRFQVVLTSGEVVNATTSQNADLYKALKGGMTNFGIVTEFEVMTIANTNIYYEIYLYAPNSTTALIDAYGNYLSDPATDVNSIVELDITANFTLAFYGYNAHTNRPKVFEPFYKIPTTSTFFPPTNGTVNDIVFGVDGRATPMGSTYGSTFSHKVPDGKFMLESYQTYLSMKAKLPSGMNFYYIPQGVTPNLVAQGKARNGGNIMNIAAIPQAWVDTYIDYADIKHTALAQSTVDTFVFTMTQKAAAEGLALPYLYPNNAAPGQKPLAAYGAQSFAYIKSVAAKYDPQGIMQTLQNDGYLVSKE